MSKANILRNNELSQIHIAKKELGLDDETYRAMLFTVARVHSAKDLDFHGRKRVLAHMKGRGWKNKSAKKAKSSRPLADFPKAKKIRALWLSLRDAGALEDASEAALGSYVRRITDVDALEWISDAQADKVIETLKQWLSRLERANEQA